MKLVIAIVYDTEGEDILDALTIDGFHVTRIASTGGFLRRGNATLLIGAEDDKVKDAIKIIHEHSAPAIAPGLKRATIFVLKVERFEQV